MDFSEHTSRLLKHFIPELEKTQQRQSQSQSHSNTNQTKVSENPSIKKLYDAIYAAHHQVYKTSCFKSTMLNSKEASGPKLTSSPYLPANIGDYIKRELKYQISYTCQVAKKTVRIHFALFSETDKKIAHIKYMKQLKMMYIWLNVCASFSANKMCSQELDVYIYPTPFNKVLPTNTGDSIGVANVNTAMTWACAPVGEIVVFREEEWFKVFIHETFHAYGLDFASSPQPHVHILKSALGGLFPIKCDFEATEAYTETWARIMNCLLVSFFALTDKADIETFFLYSEFCLQLERIFTRYQCNKVLNFMGLEYKDLYEDGEISKSKRNLYKEGTHVFSYYILTGIFMNNYSGFIDWCAKHNSPLLQFSCTAEKFKSIVEFIEREYKEPEFLLQMSKMGGLDTLIKNKDKFLLTTTRMSLFEVG